MKKNKLDIAMIIGLIVSIVGTIIIYDKLPNQIPTHWNMKGEIDDYSNKAMIYFTAFLPLGLYALMKFMPKIDPKKEAYTKHSHAYNMVIYATLIFLIGIHWVSIGYALGYSFDMMRYVRLALGILFIIIGNVMPQIRYNYFFGIRTPWTLFSGMVWKKTHMLGGYLYFVIGVIFVLSSFFNSTLSFYIGIGSLILSTLVLLIYSYLLYIKEKKYDK